MTDKRILWRTEKALYKNFGYRKVSHKAENVKAGLRFAVKVFGEFVH